MLILKVLSQGPGHGYQIAQQIKHRSQGVLDFKEGTLYPTLHGLERRGYLQSTQAEESGRTRRYYRLTESGKNLLASEQKAWRRYVKAVERNLEAGE